MNQILLAAQLCESVYRMTMPEGLGILGCQSVLDDRTRTQGMAYITSDVLWIAFAGTNERKDWLSNLKIIKKNYLGWFPAHKGFAECAEAVTERCRSVAAHYGKGRQIVVTGHSLGGAIAALIAIGLQQQAKINGDYAARPTLITFGQPRFSTRRQIEQALTVPYIRVVNGSDTVPRVPKLGYSHAGRELYLRNDDGYCINPGMTEKLIDRMTAWAHERITDHSMPGYIRQLQQVQFQ